MRPIVAATILYALGCAAGLRMAPGATTSGPLVALGVGFGLLLLFRRNADRMRVDATRILWIFAAIGLAAGSVEARRAAEDCRSRIPDGARLEAVGVLEGLPMPGAVTLLDLDRLRVDGRSVPCHGAIRVRFTAGVADSAASPAVAVRVSGRWFVTPRSGGWPVDGDRRGTLSATRVAAADAPGGRPLLMARIRAQARIRDLFEERAGIVEAILLARTEALDPELRQAFAAAGLSHLLAISGTHVGLVAGAILLLARVVRLSPALGGVTAAGMTTAYVLFLGAPSAASRAALQVLLLLGARLAQRPADPFALMSTAALVLLCHRPLALLEAGFQLSFAGVFGLLAFRRPLLERVPRAWTRTATEPVITTLAATLTTAPIAGYRFGMVSVIGLAANLVAGPALALAVPATALALAVSAAWEPAGRFLAGGAAVPIALLGHVARIAATVPGGHFPVAGATISAALLAVAVFLALNRTSRHSPPPVRRRRFGIATTGAVLLFTLPPLPRPGSGSLEIHAIDVGQGDAFAIRTPAGRWILVDTGPRTDRFDAGRSRVLPYLRARGARSVTVMVLTHPDTDHIGGAPAVLQEMRVDVALDPALATGKQSYFDVLGSARSRGVRWYAAQEGRELSLDGVTLVFLAPLEHMLDGPGEANDLSVVFRLTWGGFAALFTGDAPEAVENDLVAQHGEALSAHVLKVGHHGSRTSTGDSLLRVLRPKAALISAGQRNRYGHPDPGVVRRLERHGVHVLRTDRQGSIVIRVSPSGRLSMTSER